MALSDDARLVPWDTATIKIRP